MRLRFTALAICAVAVGPAWAASPYAGQESRDIKALSEQRIADLLAGKGMGYAKAAELNGYPGPAHVIELADALDLTAEQLADTRAIHERMEAAAKAAGAELIDAERELERLFRDDRATPGALSMAVRKVAAAEADVRHAHLLAHVEQAGILTGDQVERYNRLRGYGHHGDHRHHGH